MDSKEIFNGQKLKELRSKKRISIAELSKLSDVSTGLISQIENGKVTPSVTTLWRIVKVLNVDLNVFFSEETTDRPLVLPKGGHRILVANQESSFYKLLCPSEADRPLDFIEITLKGNTKYEQEAISHEGIECGYVLSGTLTVCVNEENFVLQAGDSIYFESTLPHKYINEGPEDCVSLWAMTPKFF